MARRLTRRPVHQLSRRLKSQPLVHWHRPPPRVDGHTSRSEAQRMLRSGLDERRADPLASVLGHDEKTLNVCRMAACGSRPRDPGEESEPCHADDLRAEMSSDERGVRMLVVCPPPRDVLCEGVNGLLCRLLIEGVLPQQPGQACDVIPVGQADLHRASVSLGRPMASGLKHNCGQRDGARICRCAVMPRSARSCIQARSRVVRPHRTCTVRPKLLRGGRRRTWVGYRRTGWLTLDASRSDQGQQRFRKILGRHGHPRLTPRWHRGDCRSGPDAQGRARHR